jgi:hypothetical protein
MPGQPIPGVGQPNPGAANTSGNQKTRIDEFLSISFDPEGKECYTVGVRQGLRGVERVMRRYVSYPDFK